MSRSRYLLAVAASVWVALFGWSAHGWSALRASAPSASSPQTTRSTEPSPARDDTRATVDKYCVTCHNQRLRTGGLALDRPDLADVAAHADVWEKVIRKSAGGHDAAAPACPHRTEAARRALVASLETTLDQAARTVARIPAGRWRIA